MCPDMQKAKLQQLRLHLKRGFDGPGGTKVNKAADDDAGRQQAQLPARAGKAVCLAMTAPRWR